MPATSRRPTVRGPYTSRVSRVPACAAVIASLFVAEAVAGTIEGRIRVIGKDGSPKADRGGVVVYVSDMRAPDKSAKAEIRQRSKEFMPRITAVPAGTTITFPNEDPEEHNVFSHSAIAEFDLGRYSKGRGKSVAFPRSGVAEIFCNVHQDMVSYVVVAPSAAVAVTGSDGSFRLDGISVGRHTLAVWDRFARPRSHTLEIEVRDGEPTVLEHEVTEALDAEPPHKNKFGVSYPTGYR